LGKLKRHQEPWIRRKSWKRYLLRLTIINLLFSSRKYKYLLLAKCAIFTYVKEKLFSINYICNENKKHYAKLIYCNVSCSLTLLNSPQRLKGSLELPCSIVLTSKAGHFHYSAIWWEIKQYIEQYKIIDFFIYIYLVNVFKLSNTSPAFILTSNCVLQSVCLTFLYVYKSIKYIPIRKKEYHIYLYCSNDIKNDTMLILLIAERYLSDASQ
jgi:hypothetical protein